jgi:glycosyltransferase involved in cell wall biosynthesis
MKVVISGVNMVEGGILSVLQDCLVSIAKLQEEFALDITVLLHSKKLLDGIDIDNLEGFHLIEYPLVKTSWLKRIKFEYIESRKISNDIKPDLWISLHDITPNVNCKVQVVYCHNPSPFYKPQREYFFYDSTFTLFNLFYKYLYGINIKKNTYVIIQQNWLREAFKKMYGVNSIVAHPIQKFKKSKTGIVDLNALNIDFKDPTFFYPSIPRVFKNFEILCEAAQILEDDNKQFEIILTLDGSENRYAKEIFEKYKHLKSLRFIGVQKRNVIEYLYSKVNCLVFPSKLETWGLPLSEFKEFDKPILAADLPYARENIGNFNQVTFFDPLNAKQLAEYMLMFIENRLYYDKPKQITPAFPFFENWDDLLTFLVNQIKSESTL